MELENTQKLEKKLKKRSEIKIPRGLKKYIRRLKNELRKNFVSEEEIKKRVNEIILKYKKKDEREDY